MRWRTATSALLLTVLVTTTSSCNAGVIPDNTFQVSNNLDRPVRLEAVDLDPSTSFGFPGSDGTDDWVVAARTIEYLGMQSGACPADDFRALDPDTGEVLATYGQSVCGGDRWSIEPGGDDG